MADINPLTWFSEILDRFLTIVVWPVFIGASILMLIWAGFLFLTAQGDPAKINSAKKAVLWAIVGIVVAILAFSVVGIITNVITPPAAAPIAPPAANGA